MAILTTFKVTGDPEELRKIAQDKVAPAGDRIGGANGRISSTVVRTDTGVMIVNLWENEEGMRRTAEQVGPIARDSGMPEQEDWQMYEVLSRS